MILPFTLSLVLSTATAGDFPLRGLTVEADVSGPLADVTWTQTFHNDSTSFVEATYTFPLPANAAVDEMVMHIADREIRGKVKERGEARAAYERAVANGQATSLVEQERPNIFTQTVGNLPPGEDIVVTLHLVVPVTYHDGAYELAFPLTVGPRFIHPGVTDAASVADAVAIAPPVARTDNGIKANISVALDTGIPLSEVASATDEISYLPDETGATVDFGDVKTDHDAVLTWRLDVDEPQAVALRQGDHVLLDMEPPLAPPREDVVPREIIWVIDTSCSMSGQPLDMAKQAMNTAFSSMDARDSFLVLDFNDHVSTLAPAPIAATPANIQAGRDYVNAFQGHGGTSMLDGIVASLDLPKDPSRERYVCFLTDGYIGNEQEILAAIADKVGGAHLYSFGLGSSVNRYLLDEMAIEGRGTARYSTLSEDPGAAVSAFLDGINQPVLSNITIDWGSTVEAYPKRTHDLIAGQPLFAVARLPRGNDADTITVHGRLGNGSFTRTLKVQDAGRGHAIASTWARQKVAELERHNIWGEDAAIKDQIIATALNYRLLTKYTSFVAIDRKVSNTTHQLSDIDIPVNIADGVEYDAAVSREWTPPGDPLLTINAPADARTVLAVYPWGDTAPMRWDSLRHRWFHRFLVPREIRDGDIQVLIYVVAKDGQMTKRVQTMHVDGNAPELDIDLSVADGLTTVTVYAEEPLRSIAAQPVGHPELRIRLDLPGDDFAHTIELPGMWAEVEVIAKDKAMNTIVARAEAEE